MDRLLRKKELVDALGVAKSTVADWVTEFHVYIPTVKQGAVIYYRPEAVDVLKAIKELRELDYSKVQIMEMLAARGFPITVEEAVEDVQRVLNQADARDTLLTVMQTMGQAVVQIGEQTERINRLEESLNNHSGFLAEFGAKQELNDERMDGQDGRMTELERMVKELQEKLVATQAELAVTKEQANKSVWRRLFGGK